jgi:PTS system nitrogen regulatory IIA component
MHLTDLLSPARVLVRRAQGAERLDKRSAVHILSELLAGGAGLPAADVERVLLEREALQSTGIGDGVAIPHGAMSELGGQCAAILVVPDGVPFEAIDGGDVNILVAVIGPKRASGEHLKTLARVSRILRSREFRQRLLGSESGAQAFELLIAEEADKR